MANYLWINPVAAKMYGDDLITIQKKLEQRGFILVSCDPQLTYVEQQYKEFSKTTQKTILDCRCPESIRFLQSQQLTSDFVIPDIEPILVRTSRVLYEMFVKEPEDQLIITCPCTQLRDFASQRLQELKRLTCLTWKEFIESHGMITLGPIEESPIPLGFFDQAFDRVLKLSSEAEIVQGISAVREQKQKKYDIIELLYCKDGCNNGNGI